MLMEKTKPNSYFALVAGDELDKYGERILQIDSEKQYTNRNGYSVFLCEIAKNCEEVKKHE